MKKRKRKQSVVTYCTESKSRTKAPSHIIKTPAISDMAPHIQYFKNLISFKSTVL